MISFQQVKYFVAKWMNYSQVERDSMGSTNRIKAKTCMGSLRRIWVSSSHENEFEIWASQILLGPLLWWHMAYNAYVATLLYYVKSGGFLYGLTTIGRCLTIYIWGME